MKAELKKARARLMLLYLDVAITLVALVGGISYFLVNHFYQVSTDNSLNLKMAIVFQSIGAPLPAELSSAMQSDQFSSTLIKPPTSAKESEEGNGYWSELSSDENAYSDELANIFVLPFDITGQILGNPNPYPLPLTPNLEAAQGALKAGYDLRTIHMPNNIDVRLLTYRVNYQNKDILIQVGKSIGEQARVINQVLMGILLLGGISIAALGIGSWWLAKRNLQPAQDAWDLQQTFIANAGHELRTPLTLIRSSMEIVKRTHLNQDQTKLVDDALQECDHMDKLVEDLLLLSRLDHQKIALEITSIDIRSFFEDIGRKIKPIADKKGIRLLINTQDGNFLGDALRIRQVVLILLDNAVRNTNSGGEVGIDTKLQADRWQISVTDNGVGISNEHLQYIFERFYRVNRPNDQDYLGNGLGLSIARGIMEAHHGSISLSSKKGKGTTVTFELPKG
jgi:signal transduction histidine kinase